MGQPKSVLVVGAGIGGLTAAIALRAKGFDVDVIERDPHWSVYGVGIIQQGNVVRAMTELGLIDDYLDAGVGFDFVEVCIPTGAIVARIPTPRLVPDRPANVGIGRRALQKVLGERTRAAGAKIRLGVTAEALDDDGAGASVHFSDGSDGRYDLVVGADGLFSQTRATLFPDAPRPEFTGQAVWRYNFPRLPELDALRVFEGQTGVGLVPLSDTLMYMYVTTPEPGNPWYPREGLAAVMRAKLSGVPAPLIQSLAHQITDDAEVVYKPLEWLFVDGPWHKGRVVLLGDAIHATTPHLGQGAGMAIEDSIVLADELARTDDIEAALTRYRERRLDRCRYIVEASRAICLGQIGLGPLIENATATREMFARIAEPI
ncbi:FAD-dependent oxidoreductase (plasmid) [Sphingomonas aliaeris]|uniref:FAD-dependent oxidoreductase n=1 Tax=Sphingomonas aliaeris TaxID=2759526 RepID=A0A974S6C7_9SPHN|nr:FAD-dependent oxidoreductase [Sphingomonas aliaeris]QQV79434.1 FAD-dependent oxidoreductase [Sphingomonas aliaeris]